MAHKAPGKAYRVGISWMELAEMFPDDATAEKWIAHVRWPEGPRCPRCNSKNVQTGATHPSNPYRCRQCRKFFSVKTGTVMQNSNLGPKVWVWAIYMLSTNLKGVSSMEFYRGLKVTQKTAWHLAHRIRETWNDSKGPFSGPVAVDETFIGGKEGNKHASKKLHTRGSKGKVAVVGMKDRDTNAVTAKVIDSIDRPTLQSFVKGNIKKGTEIFTDDLRSYYGLPQHTAVNHSVGEYVDGMAHTNGIESFWSMLKRGYHGVYHRMSAAHLDRYVNEFAGRHNVRKEDTLDQMVAVTRGFIGKRLRYRDLIESTPQSKQTRSDIF